MRLWTLHPRYLDAKGLVALWREGLLAKKVIEGRTRGYRHHPQLFRFLQHTEPLACILGFLLPVLEESRHRGYRFDSTKLPGSRPLVVSIEETTGQLSYERAHLLRKLRRRGAGEYHHALSLCVTPAPNPLFRITPGPVRHWEKRVT